VENRQKIKEQNPDLSFAQCANKLGELWKDLPEDQKAIYDEKAGKARAVYQEEMAQYKLDTEL